MPSDTEAIRWRRPSTGRSPRSRHSMIGLCKSVRSRTTTKPSGRADRDHGERKPGVLDGCRRPPQRHGAGGRDERRNRDGDARERRLHRLRVAHARRGIRGKHLLDPHRTAGRRTGVRGERHRALPRRPSRCGAPLHDAGWSADSRPCRRDRVRGRGSRRRPARPAVLAEHLDAGARARDGGRSVRRRGDLRCGAGFMAAGRGRVVPAGDRRRSGLSHRCAAGTRLGTPCRGIRRRHAACDDRSAHRSDGRRTPSPPRGR